MKYQKYSFDFLLVLFLFFVLTVLWIIFPFSFPTLLITGSFLLPFLYYFFVLIKNPFLIKIDRKKMFIFYLNKKIVINLDNVIWVFWSKDLDKEILGGSLLVGSFVSMGKKRKLLLIMVKENKKIYNINYSNEKMFGVLSNNCKNAIVGFDEKYEEKLIKYSQQEWENFVKKEREKINLPVI